jgi:hypothetical protein
MFPPVNDLFLRTKFLAMFRALFLTGVVQCVMQCGWDRGKGWEGIGEKDTTPVPLLNDNLFGRKYLERICTLTFVDRYDF